MDLSKVLHLCRRPVKSRLDHSQVEVTKRGARSGAGGKRSRREARGFFARREVSLGVEPWFILPKPGDQGVVLIFLGGSRRLTARLGITQQQGYFFCLINNEPGTRFTENLLILLVAGRRWRILLRLVSVLLIRLLKPGWSGWACNHLKFNN